MKESLDANVVEQDAALRKAAGQAFYNTSKFTMRDLSREQTNNNSRPTLKHTSMASRPTCRTLLDNFEFRNQIAEAFAGGRVSGLLIEKARLHRRYRSESGRHR